MTEQLVANDESGDAATGTTEAGGAAASVGAAMSAQDAGTSEGPKLLRRLADELRELQDQLAAGETPDADDLEALNDTLDRLGEILGFSLTTAQAATPEAANDDPTVPAADATDTGRTSALAGLTTALGAASLALTALSPELAKKLEAFADRLGAVEADPQALAALAGNAEDTVAGSAAFAKLPKPQQPVSEFTSLIQLSRETQLQGGGTATDPAEPPIADTGAAATETPETRAPALAATAHASSHGEATEQGPLVAETSDPEPGKTETTSSSQTTAEAASGAAAATPQSRALAAAYQPLASSINMGHLAFQMVHQVQKGLSRFSIRLDPAELGRIDVRMSVDQSGAVTARLTVDRSETLDLFQRDRSALERALTQAGLDAGKTSLEFSLRQNPSGGNTGDDNREATSTYTADSSSTPTDGTDTAVTFYRGAATARGVNILA